MTDAAIPLDERRYRAQVAVLYGLVADVAYNDCPVSAADFADIQLRRIFLAVKAPGPGLAEKIDRVTRRLPLAVFELRALIEAHGLREWLVSLPRDWWREEAAWLRGLREAATP